MCIGVFQNTYGNKPRFVLCMSVCLCYVCFIHKKYSLKSIKNLFKNRIKYNKKETRNKSQVAAVPSFLPTLSYALITTHSNKSYSNVHIPNSSFERQ